MFDDTEYWCNIWRKTELCFQKWHEEFSKFSSKRVWKSKNWDFNGIFLSKVENLWAQNLQGSLKRIWFVSSKLTWGIWQILTGALENPKNLHFNRLLLTKVCNVWAKKKYRGVMFEGTEVGVKFEGNWLVLSKNFCLVAEK